MNVLSKILTIITRILLIAGILLAAHYSARLIQMLSRKILQSRVLSQEKFQTLTSFITSVSMFVLYFLAIGIVFRELGISLSTYLASASVVGLAVSFGSQGVIQDVIMGLTVVLSDLLDIGDMVEIGGQVGVVQRIGIRFTELINFSGARIFIPNRTLTNVINYPTGYIRIFLDVRLPDNIDAATQAEAHVKNLTRAAYEQFPGSILLPPTFYECERSRGGYQYMRVKFRVWPGQGGIIEGVVKQNVVQALRQFDPLYADWMVVVHYRAEPKHKTQERLLPRPAALQRLQKAEDEDQAQNVVEEDTPKRRNLFTFFLKGS